MRPDLRVLLDIPPPTQHILPCCCRRADRIHDNPCVGSRRIVGGRRRLGCELPELLTVGVVEGWWELRASGAADTSAAIVTSTGDVWYGLGSVGISELVHLTVRGLTAQPLPRSQLQAGTGFSRHVEAGGKVPTSTSRAGICSSGRPSRYRMVCVVPMKGSTRPGLEKHDSVSGSDFGQTE